LFKINICIRLLSPIGFYPNTGISEWTGSSRPKFEVKDAHAESIYSILSHLILTVAFRGFCIGGHHYLDSPRKVFITNT